jgi:hypothetical protein
MWPDDHRGSHPLTNPVVAHAIHASSKSSRSNRTHYRHRVTAGVLIIGGTGNTESVAQSFSSVMALIPGMWQRVF